MPKCLDIGFRLLPKCLDLRLEYLALSLRSAGKMGRAGGLAGWWPRANMSRKPMAQAHLLSLECPACLSEEFFCRALPRLERALAEGVDGALPFALGA